LRQEDDFCLGSKFAHSPGGLDSVQLWQTDIEYDQVGLQCLGLPDSFESISYLADDMQIRLVVERRGNKSPKRFIIIHQEDAHISESFSQ
jgi:hypothetical protein